VSEDIGATRCRREGTPPGAWLTLAARLLLGAIFLLAGGAKLGTPAAFASALTAYRLLPAALVPAVAFALPWLEVLIGVYLVLGLFTRWAALAALGLFMLALSAALLRGLPLAGCGCFGALGWERLPVLGLLLGGADAGPGDLVRDASYALLALLVLRGPPSAWALDRHLGRSP